MWGVNGNGKQYNKRTDITHVVCISKGHGNKKKKQMAMLLLIIVSAISININPII